MNRKLRYVDLIICLVLTGVTLAIYWLVRHYGIIDYDDPFFLTENEHLIGGLNWHSIWWALSSVVVANWHPVTNLSFLFNHALFGLSPEAEHTTNVILHATNALLLYFVLKLMTGARYRCAIVAAIFAWHPLRVESVAWISERKDVLAGFFMILTLLAYAKYVSGVRCQESGQDGRVNLPVHRGRWYWLALCFFALGLMSKPVLVTLPFVLLLLDVWPLQRISWTVASSGRDNLPVVRGTLVSLWEKLKPLLWEKVPFFILTTIFCWLTLHIQKAQGSVISGESLPISVRLPNVLCSYGQYLWKLFWPAKLALLYPFAKSQDVPLAIVLACAFLMISGLFIRLVRTQPYLAIGWFWFLGTAVPIIGLVQTGEQAMADRHTYIMLIGPVMAAVWAAFEFAKERRAWQVIISILLVFTLSAMMFLARKQVSLWRDTVTLFKHTVDVTSDNPSAQFYLAVGLERQGRVSEAIDYYRVASKLSPSDYRPHYSLAKLLESEGRNSEAIADYQAVATLGARPNDFISQMNTADALTRLGQVKEAVIHLEEALRIKPDSLALMNNLAWMLATSPEPEVRNPKRAIELATKACDQTKYSQTMMVGTLAAAYASDQRFEDAVATAEKATALAQQHGEQDLLETNRNLLERYREHKSLP